MALTLRSHWAEHQCRGERRTHDCSDAQGDASAPVRVVTSVESDASDLRGRQTCSVDEAAQLLGIGRSTAYAAAHDGTLPTLKISHRLLVSVPRLLALIGLEPEQRAEGVIGRPVGNSGPSSDR